MFSCILINLIIVNLNFQVFILNNLRVMHMYVHDLQNINKNFTKILFKK